jgi:hypothetical protein
LHLNEMRGVRAETELRVFSQSARNKRLRDDLRNLMSEVKKFESFSLLAQWRLRIAVAAGILCLQSSPLSAEATLQTCGPPNIYGAALISPENRLGEFLIELQTPDYSDRNSVREHLIFSRIWSRILRSNLRTKTRVACDAILDASFFPSLWAFLTVETPRDAVSDRAQCLNALQEGLTQPEQDASVIKKAADDEMTAIQRWSESRGNFIVEADNILKKSTPLIYNYGTVMEALASVGAKEFQEINVDNFEQWLRRQSALVKIFRVNFSSCAGDSESASNLKLGTEAGRFPSSSVTEPGVINVRVGDQEKGPLLYSAVIIGLKTPPSFLPGATTVVQADVLAGYCNHERAFFDDSVASNITVMVRCLRVVELTKPWVVLFCDPKNCSTKQLADTVAKAIARDPAILALVQANTENSQPIGPYLVNVE